MSATFPEAVLGPFLITSLFAFLPAEGSPVERSPLPLPIAGMGMVSQAGAAADAPPTTATVGFEQAVAGPCERLETSLGVWTSTVGISRVDDRHAHTGRQCLQLTGGERTSVTLDLADDVDPTGQLSFWAERWTRRTPFSFRVEKNDGQGWVEIFNGDDEVRVGRGFLSNIIIPLGDGDIQQLRFTVVSPPGTGLLMDDVRLTPARPQRIVSVQSVPMTLPALKGVSSSPLLKLKVVAEGSLTPVALTQLTASLLTAADDVESLQVFVGTSTFAAASPLAAERTSAPASHGAGEQKILKLAKRQALAEGENFVWIAGKISPQADVDRAVTVACSQVVFSNGKTMALTAQSAQATQRIGVAVRKGGDDGVHTFRIPGLARTPAGTLIGVYDVRRRGGGDLPGDIDVGMSRSTDGGRTWESMKIVMDMGDDPAWRYDGIGDPAVLVDEQTGTIWVAATWSHGNRSWVGSQPGLTPEETGQLMLVRSDDDGLTWSPPINITRQVKDPRWSFLLQGPGKGITMRDGTLVFAAQYQDPPHATDRRAHRLPHSTIIYSQDHGKTWSIGTGAFPDTTESQVVEIEPGVLMLNCRYNRKAARVVMITRDMGRTWQPHATSEHALIEPGSCMASLIDVGRELEQHRGTGGDDGAGAGNAALTAARRWLLFANPDSTRGRHHITIKASPDLGRTWPTACRLLLDEGTGRGYSCLAMIDEQTVGILYEGSQADMTFQRIPLRDLMPSR